VGFEESRVQRRRSERVTRSLPIVVRGVDLLGQEFEERTATLSVNLHGCRYASRYHLPKNTWITMEIARGSEFCHVRARVAWIQRPHSVREFFQINAELETPQNLWLFEPLPADWASVEAPPPGSAADEKQVESQASGILESETPASPGPSRENLMNEMNAMSGGPQSILRGSEIPVNPQTAEHPLLRDFRAELERRAAQAADEPAPAAETVLGASPKQPSWVPEELFEKWKGEFEQAQHSARETLAGYQGELLEAIKSEFEAGLSQARLLIDAIEKNRDELGAENQAAAATAVRLAQERLELGAIRDSQANADAPKGGSFDEAASEWRDRLHSEMNAAQTQWNELLQSTLDGGLRRMVAQFSENSREIARAAQDRFSEEVAGLGQPLLQNLAEVRETFTSLKSGFDEELARAKSSLAEIEHAVSKANGSSAQIDAAAREALDELNRRLRIVLDAQTEEMANRAEALTAGSAEKVASALDALKRRVVGEAATEIESKLAPHMDRLPEILRDLSMKELQVEESLRLHRERLRQMSESSERDLRSHFDAATADSRQQLDGARREAAVRLQREIDAGASQAAASAMESASQGLEEAARGRLQALIEQGLAEGTMTLAAKTEEMKQNFAADLEAQSSERAVRIREEIDGFTAELTGQARTQIEQAAEVTANAFGQVLRGISDLEIEQFSARTADAAQETAERLETSGIKLLRNFETSAESSLARFHQEMTSQLDASIVEGRSVLSSEFTSALTAYRLERETHEKEWTDNLERISGDALGRYQERINTAGDSFVLSSVRRLNEHGQQGLEGLMRSADQALRESCAKLFDGLAEILRERSSEFPGRPAGTAREAAEAAPPFPADDSALNQPNL
jgi:hypothetical protein